MVNLDSTISEVDTGDGIHYETLVPFRYYCGEGKTGLVVEVPAGFRYDKATVPFLARAVLWLLVFLRLFPPLGKFSRAALLHDYLYKTQQFSRFLTDAIFWDAARSTDIGKFPRWVYWFCIRMGGQETWDKYTEAKNGSD